MTDDGLAISTYLRLKTLWTGSPATRRKRAKQKPTGSEPFTTGRDPVSAAEALVGVTSQLGWEQTLAQATLVTDWENLVGPETAQNSRIEKFDDGVLTVRCSSTAWSTQLNFMAVDIRTKVLAEHPDAGVEKITFIGPNAPSWKRGPKSVPGRGARDTYG